MRTLSTFYAKDLVIEKTKTPKPKPKLEGLVFGAVPSDHILEIDWNKTKGWEKPKISPYHNFEINPANSSLHYALQCFEGMKAYIDTEGKARLFRPLKNCERMLESFKALYFPKFDPAELLKCIEQFALLEKEWIPNKALHSLYLRPTGISMTNQLGVTAATDVKLFVMGCPVGPYYAGGFKPVKLFVETEGARAWAKGSGDKKIGPNYGPTVKYSERVKPLGYQQILWLTDDKYISEAGVMNIFFFIKNRDGENELITPVLDGTILPGITRESIITYWTEKKEFKVIPRMITIDEICEIIEDGRMLEAFGAGTAAICSPIASFTYKGKTFQIPFDQTKGSGPVTERTINVIQDIQYGKIDHPWSHKLE